MIVCFQFKLGEQDQKTVLINKQLAHYGSTCRA